MRENILTFWDKVKENRNDALFMAANRAVAARVYGNRKPHSFSSATK